MTIEITPEIVDAVLSHLLKQPGYLPEPELSKSDNGTEGLVEKTFTLKPFQKNQKKQIVYGVVLRPNKADSQADVITPDDVERAAHLYMVRSRKSDWQHAFELGQAEAIPVESHVSMVDFKVGDDQITKGDWIVGMWVPNTEYWNKIEAGEATAFSITGTGQRIPLS